MGKYVFIVRHSGTEAIVKVFANASDAIALCSTMNGAAGPYVYDKYLVH